MKRTSSVLLFFALVFVTLLPGVTVASSLKKVLLLHSYHSGYKWTDDINSAVQRRLSRASGVDLRVEFLDTKRYSSSAYYALQKELLSRKYQNEKFDLVICSDNNALSFLLQNREDLFPATPAVFAGINFFKEEILHGQGNITGVNEAVDLKKSIDLMLRVHPQAKRIVTLIDGTTTGRILAEKIGELQPDYPSVEWLTPEGLTMEEWEQLLQSLKPDDLVLLGLFLRDGAGTFFEYDEVATRISAASPVPVYVLWDFYLEYGVVGGYLASGTFQGEKASDIAMQILGGTPADDIPVVMDSPNRYLADYDAMARFHIDEGQFPPETIIYHQPVNFYKKYKSVIWTFFCLFILLSLLTLFLSVTVSRKKRAESALLALTEELEARVEKRTAELSLANTQIMEREQQMQNLLTNLSSMIYRCKNDENWTMVFVSDGSVQLTGYKGEELINNSVISYADLIDERDRQMVADTVAGAVAAGENFTLEYRIHTRDNQMKWVWEQGVVMYDDQGQVLFLDGKIMDISERKTIELEQMKLATAVQQTDDLIVITNLGGSIEYVNPAFEKTTGYSLLESLGRNPRILKSGAQSAEFYQEMWTTLLAGSVWRGRMENRRKDGTGYMAEVTISPIRDQQGELTHFVGVQRDISHEIALENNLRQAQKLEAMGTLAGGIAHEINTPAQFVSSNLSFFIESFPDLARYVSACTDYLQQEDEKQGKKEELLGLYEDNDISYLLEEIPLALVQSQEGVDQVSKIVLSMKQFSHPGEEEKVEADLNEALKNTATVCRNEWKYVADMKFELDPALPLVACHRSEVNQVFVNIIVNAAHAIGADIQEGGEKGTITISSSVNDGCAEITIADTGGGIPAGIRERIFDPFFTTKEPGKGTGQGLAIAYSIICDKHGGQLSFDSREGEGTVFSIRLPLHP